MTRAEKKAAKIRAAEKKRLQRDERKSARTRRSRDGTFAKKDSKTHFGYKLHSSVGVDMPLICLYASGMLKSRNELIINTHETGMNKGFDINNGNSH